MNKERILNKIEYIKKNKKTKIIKYNFLDKEEKRDLKDLLRTKEEINKKLENIKELNKDISYEGCIIEIYLSQINLFTYKSLNEIINLNIVKGFRIIDDMDIF